METIQAEVESLLSQLGNINEEMAGLAAGAGAGGGGAAIHHTLQRHAEILQVSTVIYVLIAGLTCTRWNQENIFCMMNDSSI